MISTIKRFIGNLEDAAARIRGIDEKLVEMINVIRGQGVSELPPEPPPARPAVQISVAPLIDVPFLATVDIAALDNPLPAIAESPELIEAAKYFARTAGAARSLVSAESHAWLYSLVRLVKPLHVIEIGTYMAGTSQTICRALALNQRGKLHTTDPFGAERVPPILDQWSAELRDRILFYPLNSMDFFARLQSSSDIKADIIFIDGNHDYEFAAFDIASAARVIVPGGFIIIDNVSQAGPFFAAQDFLAANPQWRECRVTEHIYDAAKAYDPTRSNVSGTDSIVLRAPFCSFVGDRPVCFGEVLLPSDGFDYVLVQLGPQTADGTLHVQAVLRGFSERIDPTEQVKGTHYRITANDTDVDLSVPLSMRAGPDYEVVRVELWLRWTGKTPLALRKVPMALTSTEPSHACAEPVANVEQT